MALRISIIIPNYNGCLTIGRCLEAAFESKYSDFEVIVGDDGSTDNSPEIIRQFPCTLIRFEDHKGASAARNAAAAASNGDILFFIDADCILSRDALYLVSESMKSHDSCVIGGTYSPIPFDSDFFSSFQSIFINYFETKLTSPDYVASHAMAIRRDVFIASGGFPENFMPIIEDVEFSHRLRRAGYSLRMNPLVQVTHIFNFTLLKSLRNAFKKSFYWTLYSAVNKDLLADSGTASREIKINVAIFCISLLGIFFGTLFGKPFIFYMVPISYLFDYYVNRNLFKAFYSARGTLFAVLASFYYMFFYPIPIAAGGVSAIIRHYTEKIERQWA